MFEWAIKYDPDFEVAQKELELIEEHLAKEML